MKKIGDSLKGGEHDCKMKEIAIVFAQKLELLLRKSAQDTLVLCEEGKPQSVSAKGFGFALALFQQGCQIRLHSSQQRFCQCMAHVAQIRTTDALPHKALGASGVRALQSGRWPKAERDTSRLIAAEFSVYHFVRGLGDVSQEKNPPHSRLCAHVEVFAGIPKVIVLAKVKAWDVEVLVTSNLPRVVEGRVRLDFEQMLDCIFTKRIIVW